MLQQKIQTTLLNRDTFVPGELSRLTEKILVCMDGILGERIVPIKRSLLDMYNWIILLEMR